MTIQVFQPSLGAHELEAVGRVFDSNWIGKGPKVAELEREWAGHIEVSPDKVVATTSATEGLFQVCQLLHLEKDDEVVMPTISFNGAANAVVAAGGKPIFCDVNERALNPSLDDIRSAVTRKTRAIIVLHYGGVPSADLLDIAVWCEENSIALIEDCAISPASTVGGVACGTLGDFGIWSFDPMKIISAGDGGTVYCRDENDAFILRRAINLGMTTDSGYSSSKTSRWWEFGIFTAGRKATMNDITAAIVLEQLDRLPEFVRERARRTALYNALLADSWVTLPPAIPDHLLSSFYAYWIQCDHRDELAAYLKGNGVYTTFRYHPLNTIPFYGVQRLTPKAERAAARTLLLPLHQSLSADDVERVCNLIKSFGEQYDN